MSKKISRKNIPNKVPISQVLVYVMALDYFDAPVQARWVVYTLIAIIVIFVLVDIVNEEEVDLFK